MLGCEGENTKGEKIQGDQIIFPFVSEGKKKKEIKERRKIISLCGGPVQPGVGGEEQLQFSETSTLGCPEPPWAQAGAVEFENSRSWEQKSHGCLQLSSLSPSVAKIPPCPTCVSMFKKKEVKEDGYTEHVIAC